MTSLIKEKKIIKNFIQENIANKFIFSHKDIDDFKTERLDFLSYSDCSPDIYPLNDILVLI